MAEGTRRKISAGNKKIDSPQIRKANREAILDYIKRVSGIRKSELSVELGLSRPTVTGILEELENAGFIAARRSEVNTGGRSAMEYVLVPDAYRAAGLQLSAHHIRGVIVNLAGEIIGRIRVKRTFGSDEAYRRELGNIYQELLDDAGLTADDVTAVGVAVQALTDVEGKKITYMPNETAALSKYDQLLKYIPGEKRFFHDLTALGYNEKLKIDRNVFYLSINNRIGGMVLIDGEVYNGSGNRAGEVGHLQLMRGGRQCYCGNKGCFDAYCNTDVLRKCAGDRLDVFFKGLDQGIEEYRQCIEEYLEYLGNAVFSIRVIFDGVIIIGGELGEYSEYYLNELRDILDEKAFFPDEHASEYLFADKTGEYAVATGAAMYYCGHVLDGF